MKKLFASILIAAMAVGCVGCSTVADNAAVTVGTGEETGLLDGIEVFGYEEDAVEHEIMVDENGYEYYFMDEPRYVMCDMYVHTEPSGLSETIGNYDALESIAVIGQYVESGWYRVNYYGEYGCINGNYVSLIPTQERLASLKSAMVYSLDELDEVSVAGVQWLGNNLDESFVGRVIIPDVGVDVACFASDEQAVIDEEDAACYHRWWDTFMIGDHNMQGFSAIMDCVPGETVMYIAKGETVYRYICTGVDLGGYYEVGTTDINTMRDSEGNLVGQMNGNGMTLTTCNDNEYGDNGCAIVWFVPYPKASLAL